MDTHASVTPNPTRSLLGAPHPIPFRTYSLAAPLHPGDSGQVGREKGKVSSPVQNRRKGQGRQRTYLVLCIKRKPPK